MWYLQLLYNGCATVVKSHVGLATIVQRLCNCCEITWGTCNYCTAVVQLLWNHMWYLQLLYNGCATVVKSHVGLATIVQRLCNCCEITWGTCNYCTAVVQLLWNHLWDLQLLFSSRATVVKSHVVLATIVQRLCNCCEITCGTCNYCTTVVQLLWNHLWDLQLLYNGCATVVKSPVGLATIVQQSCNCCEITCGTCNYCTAVVQLLWNHMWDLQLLYSSRATVVKSPLGFAIISRACNYCTTVVQLLWNHLWGFQLSQGLATIVQQSCNCCEITSGVCNYLKGLQLLYNGCATVVKSPVEFAIISGNCNYWNQWKGQWNPPQPYIYTCLQSCTIIAWQLHSCRAVVAPQSLSGEIIAQLLYNCRATISCKQSYDCIWCDHCMQFIINCMQLHFV